MKGNVKSTNNQFLILEIEGESRGALIGKNSITNSADTIKSHPVSLQWQMMDAVVFIYIYQSIYSSLQNY